MINEFISVKEKIVLNTIHNFNTIFFNCHVKAPKIYYLSAYFYKKFQLDISTFMNAKARTQFFKKCRILEDLNERLNYWVKQTGVHNCDSAVLEL